SMARWLAFNSVVAFIRFAKNRSSSGAIASSRLHTMNHDGFISQATGDLRVESRARRVPLRRRENAGLLFGQIASEVLHDRVRVQPQEALLIGDRRGARADELPEMKLAREPRFGASYSIEIGSGGPSTPRFMRRRKRPG